MNALLLALAVSAAAVPKLEGMEVKPDSPILFESGKATLKPESDAALESVKSLLEAKSYVSLLRIEGHSPDPASQELTGARALAVAKALVARGVDCKRLLPVGFGDSKPVSENATPEGKAQNRRTTFVVTALRGKAVGGMPVDGGGKPSGDPCAK